MLGQRRRRWPNVQTASVECPVFAGIMLLNPFYQPHSLVFKHWFNTGPITNTMAQHEYNAGPAFCVRSVDGAWASPPDLSSYKSNLADCDSNKQLITRRLPTVVCHVTPSRASLSFLGGFFVIPLGQYIRNHLRSFHPTVRFQLNGYPGHVTPNMTLHWLNSPVALILTREH